MRVLIGGLVVAAVVSGCGTYALPTDPEWHYVAGEGCRGVGLDGILRGSTSDPRVFWMVDRPTGERVEIIWPAGHQARFDLGLEVVDERGTFVGKEGDLVIGTCFRREPGDPLHVSADGVQAAP